MTLTTTTLGAIALLILIAGWLFGLASHSGGRKWRERYAAERDAHAAYRKEVEARVAEANRRVAEAERDRDRLARAAPVTAATVAPAATPVRDPDPYVRDDAPVRATAARPAFSRDPNRGWFDWTKR